jgi:hypothetical protein
VAEKLISYTQLGKTRIGRVYEVADRNLDNEDTYRAYPINLTSEGVRVMGSTLNTVWIKFQAPAPQFSADPWDVAGDYDRYQVVFSPATVAGEMPEKGECYMVEQDANGNYFWMLVQFPELLARFVVHTAAADLCRYYGKPDSADRLEAIGYDAIVNEARKLGLVAKFTVRVR